MSDEHTSSSSDNPAPSEASPGGSGGEGGSHHQELHEAAINLSDDRKGMVLMPDQGPPQIDPVAHMDGPPSGEASQDAASGDAGGGGSDAE
jgi:hypothetical protein